MGPLMEIKLGEFRQVGMFDCNTIACKRGDIVILEVEKGVEYGKAVGDFLQRCASKNENTQGKVLRLANEGDLRQIVNNQIKAKESLEICRRLVAEAVLDMRLVDAEYAFDSSKVLFLFTSEGRVDFRNLVKDLARTFRVRIELKQIGVRDKAKIIGGIGVCGRALCCSSYMKNFHPLSIKMAKDQGLPLNPTKISGVCGRVKCCMAYEYQTYRDISRTLPKMGARLTTSDGDKGRVVAIDILKQIVTIDCGEGKMTKILYPALAETQG